jgi:hypothetical protein
MITEALDITVTQLEAIWNWRVASFGPTFIYPNTIAKYNLSVISDLGWVQFGAVCAKRKRRKGKGGRGATRVKTLTNITQLEAIWNRRLSPGQSQSIIY